MQQASAKEDAKKHLTIHGGVVLLWEISNDLGEGASVQDAFDRYRGYCLARRKAGFKVIAMTVLPRHYPFDAPGFEGRRLVVNQMLRDQVESFADGLIDVAAIPEIGME